MTSLSILPGFTPFPQLGERLRQLLHPSTAACPSLHYWAQHRQALPAFVQASPLALRYLRLLGRLNWDHFPERDLQHHWSHTPVPYAPFAAACLVKLDQHLAHMSSLRQFLVDNPAVLWVLGFPLVPASQFAWGFDADQSLPTHRHLTRMLRQMPNSVLQFLLANSVDLLRAELHAAGQPLGACVSLDTKHILAWVKENNPKAYVRDRFDKNHQPAGDPDCRLGCKRRHNQSTRPAQPVATPTHNPVPAKTLAVGEFYWGYGSGIVATKVPDWGEFVLAELTQPFDQADVSYFYPLLETTEKRLGFRSPYAAFDAAFDAFYVYDYFAQAGGFAAVPFSERGGHKQRQFTAAGLPLCAAGLAMPLKYKFVDRSTRVEHERGRYVCPLQYPQSTNQACPIQDPHWAKGGCATTMATSLGARLRYTLDRHSEEYQQVYKQRTATERINSQAVELGIERPKIRNGQAIANLNTLIYVLINLRALQRIGEQKGQPQAAMQSAVAV